MRQETLCNTCAVEVFRKCVWVLSGKAVKGWKAKKTVVINEGQPIESRCVKACPNYIKDMRKSDFQYCRQCGKAFQSHNKRKYCSEECRKKATCKMRCEKYHEAKRRN